MEVPELIPQPVRLIEEVKKRPGLWSPAISLSREEKLELWKDVGAGMYPDWKTYSKAVKYDTVIQLQSKWRSLRDGYNREVRFRKSGVRKYNRTYVYFKRLLFLGGYDGEVSSDEEQDSRKSKRNKIQFKKDLSVESDDTEPQYLELYEQEPSTSNKKQKRIKTENLTSSPKPQEICEIMVPGVSDSPANQDSDRLYLLSFLPDLVQLPRTVKMWAKTQIAQVMEEAVNHHLNGSCPMSRTRDPIAEPDTSHEVITNDCDVASSCIRSGYVKRYELRLSPFCVAGLLRVDDFVMFSNHVFEVENFIYEVKKHPVIWTSPDDPRHQGTKQDAWQEVAQVFVEDFDDKSRVQKFEIIKLLQSKWRNIRDCYVRTLKNPKKKYIHKQILTFLSSDSDKCDDNESDEQSVEELPIKREITETQFEDTVWSSDRLVPSKRSKRESDFEYVNITSDASVVSNPTFGSGMDEKKDDDDRFFFQSLLPAVREFDMDKKLEFRTEVLSLIKRLRSSNT